MAEWGEKLPENLGWVKGSPFIWYEFWHEGVRFRGSTKTNNLKLAKDRLSVERNKAITADYKKDERTLTLNEAFARYWIEHVQFQKSALRSMKQHIEHIMGYFGQNKLLHEIDGGELSKYVAHCRTEKHRGHGWKKSKPTSPANINRRLSTFQGMHRMAWETWGVEVKPIKFKALKLAEPDPVDNTYTPEQVELYMQHAEEHLVDYLMLDIFSGLRKGNLLTLNGIKQINIEKREITVWGKSRKKEGKKIIVPIPEELMHYIIAKGIHLRKHVITYKGKPIKDIVTAHEGAIKRAGLKHIRLHDFRHTCGKWLYAKTKDIKLVKDWLGHSSFATTERYVHSDTESKLETANNAGLPSFKHIRRVK